MRTLLNDVREKLNDLNLFRYIDDDWGQLDDYAQSPPTKWPCALVDIIDAKPQSLSRRVQNIECTILIRVADLRLSNSSQQAPKTQRNKYEELFNIMQTVFSRFHGWHAVGSAYGTLSRIGFRRNHRDDGVREYHILFRCVVKDTAAVTPIEDIANQVPDYIRPHVTVAIQK